MSYDVPVAPLEVQLQTCLARGPTERGDEVERVLRSSGYDQELLWQALSPQNEAVTERL
jgi:hypothetical protein